MTEDQLRKILNEQLAQFFGQFSKHFSEQQQATEDRLSGRLDRIDNTLDGIAKRLENDELERAAMQHQLNRHERWHKQTAKKLDLKLDYES